MEQKNLKNKDSENDYVKFAHLHCHSDYSLYDGFQKIAIYKDKEIVGGMVKRASDLKMKAIALTDHGKVGGFIKFYKACKALKIKPIFGIEAYLCENLEDRKSKRYHLTVLAKNEIGYRNILKLSSVSHNYIVKVFNNEIPRIDWQILKQYSEGLIILSGCIASQFSQLIVERDDLDGAKNLAKKCKDIWGEDYYIEVMWTKHEPQKKQIKHALQIAKELDIKPVCTNDCHYSFRSDAKFQRTKISISRNSPLRNDDDFQEEYYIKSYDEMSNIFSGNLINCVHNTMEIVDKSNVELKLNIQQLPHYDIPKDDDSFNKFKQNIWNDNLSEVYLRYLSEEGLKKKGLYNSPGYLERLNKELETIKFTGFTTYFLVVWEYCRWARENDIRVGAGRGSGAGSLVLYVLEVTNIDPIKHDLLMDRFLYAEAEYKTKIDDFFSHVKKEENIHGEECNCPICR